MDGVTFAFLLTLFAGLSTGIGSIVAFTVSRTNYRFLSVATGFSAGVMLYVSFVEIFVKGSESLIETYGEYWGSWLNVASFFGGMLVIGVIDNLIPNADNPHEAQPAELIAPLTVPGAPIPPEASQSSIASMGGAVSGSDVTPAARRKLMRMGLFTALAIGIHNFPEGLATFLAALEDGNLGVAIAVAVALHNIPEGVAVAVPVFYATGSRTKAFIYSFSSGLAEPVGALLAYVALLFFVGDESGAIPSQVMGILFGGVAGIMVYISVDELLPTSRAYGKGHDSLFGMVGGMVVMALSLLLMK